MIAGPNGSGKTTLTKELRDRAVDFGTYINPDDIAAGLRGSYEARVLAAQVEADRLREECLSAGRSFSFETVMSHVSKIEVLRRARVAGFETALHFVSTEKPELNVARVRQRVALGGHAVPEDRIVSRYWRTMSLLPDAISEANYVVLFDNSMRMLRGAPVMLRPFLRFHRGPTPKRQIIHPIPKWGRACVRLVQKEVAAFRG